MTISELILDVGADVSKELTLDHLNSSPVIQKVRECMNTFGRFQQVAYALNNDDDDGTLAVLKTGTVLSVSIFEMMLRGGKSPGEFNSMDWHEILGEVGQNVQGQNFSVFVFDRYARYIDVSVQLRGDRLSDTMQDEVTELAGELRDLTTSLQNGGIKEPDYVDRLIFRYNTPDAVCILKNRPFWRPI